MEAFGEYRVGQVNSGFHWIECRGERIAEVAAPAEGPERAWRYGSDNRVRIESMIPGWTFEGTPPVPIAASWSETH